MITTTTSTPTSTPTTTPTTQSPPATSPNDNSDNTLPSFEYKGDKKGCPLIDVKFADGTKDTLILHKLKNEPGYCIGHLKNEQEACVAVVTHKNYFEFTLLSRHTMKSTMYKWHCADPIKHKDCPLPDGISEVQRIPEVFSGGKYGKLHITLKNALKSLCI